MMEGFITIPWAMKKVLLLALALLNFTYLSVGILLFLLYLHILVLLLKRVENNALKKCRHFQQLR